MINPSPCLIPFGDPQTLRESFAAHVRGASAYDLERRERGDTTTRAITLERILAERLERLDEMTPQDLMDAFTFFEGFVLGRRDESVLAKATAALRMGAATPSAYRVVNRWLKFVFMRMWCDGHVMFPLRFKLGSSFPNGEIRAILPDVVTCHLDNKEREMAAFGISLTLASRWRAFADIDLDMLGPFSFMLGEDYRKREILGLRRRDPYVPFTSALWAWHKGGCGKGFRYTDEDIRGYLYWLECRRRGSTDAKPSEFIPGAAARRKAVRSKVSRDGDRRVAAAQVDLIEHERKADFRQAILSGERTLQEVRFEILAERAATGDGIVEYVRLVRARAGRRGASENPYPFRMHAFPRDAWAAWNDMFERYFALRARQGFEGGPSWETFRYVFMDYLCCYLPWWNEMHPGLGAPVPEDPSRLVRFGLWVEGVDEVAPLPLLRFYDAVRHGTGGDGFNAFISDAHKFFAFCRGDAASLRMRNARFDNPVVPEIDRKVVRGAAKTNKTPIPTAVLPVLLRYAYACEAFFLRLTEAALAGGLPPPQRRLVGTALYNGAGYETAGFADVCGGVGFEFDGRRYDIATVPALAVWEERQVRPPGETKTRTAFLPQVSGLRLAISALETGIRFQGLQWLCRSTYRSLVDARTAAGELVPLVVNTDKVRDRPWKTLIVRRAYELLLREEAYQDLLSDAFVDRPIFYERREHTRFAPVLPLFRGAQSKGPVNDKTYSTAWERLIVGFDEWYARQHPEAEPLRMWRFGPDLDPMTGDPRVVMHVDGGERRPTCPLRVRLRHTPHSARSTFITARSGILPIEMTGWLVGQTNKATTYHYTVESEEEVGRKVMAAANSLWDPDRENPVHIRADVVNSALRRSFEADRARTESAFGFQTLSLLNAEAPDADGVTLLRSTPMGKVVFRETHVCPVGEMCPSDLMDVLVEPRRCGVCPLAVKSVDHLPSIAAKCRHLLEQVREGAKTVARMRERGEPSATVEEVQKRRRIDLMEYEGWRTTLHTLTAKLGELRDAGKDADLFHVGMPEAVRLHLSLVTRDADVAEFLLQRICDSAWHAGFETPTLRAQAAQLRQRLLASDRALEAEIDLYEDDPVRSILSTLRLSLASRGIGATYAAALDVLRRAAVGGSVPILRLPEPAETPA